MKPDKKLENSSKERFTRFADGYVTSQSHAKGTDLNLLVEIAKPQADWLVLDIATGGGHTALKFAPTVDRVIATDITPKMLSAAENFVHEQGVTNISFQPVDAQDLPFEDGIFDLVTCRIAPHHFLDCAGFVQEAGRVLKTGGTLVVQDHVLPEDKAAARYIDDFERLRDPSHNRAFNSDEWIRMFERAGLEVSNTREITKRHQLYPWAERQGCSPQVIVRLLHLLNEAPPKAVDWLQVQNLGLQTASFVNHHILIAGIKPVNRV